MINRYSLILGPFKREIVLLKGNKCSYGKCKFCNYTKDNETNSELAFNFNKEILNKVTGQTQILEVINSGNVTDIDLETLRLIKRVCNEKNIKTLYFESYLNELPNLKYIRKYFHNTDVRFRLGMETFDDKFRSQLGKNFRVEHLLEKIKENYYSVCIMCCIEGQNKKSILDDLIKGFDNFDQVTVNIFIDNDTPIKRDQLLVDWFIKDIYPIIKDSPKFEILIDNKDLGVFEQ